MARAIVLDSKIAPDGGVQRPRDAARAPRRRARRAAARAEGAARGGRRDPRRRAHPRGVRRRRARAARRTGTRSTSRRSWRCASSTASTRRSSTSARYGSDHTEVIVTRELRERAGFAAPRDSSTVGVNCSTALRGRLPARARRRDRHLHLEAARATGRWASRGSRRTSSSCTGTASSANERGARGVGVFGGTFNPIHFGHLRAAEEVREALGLERVLFVPSARPPHKAGRSGPIAPAAQRLAWVRRRCAGNPRLGAWTTLELARGGPSYPVDTLRALARAHGAEPAHLHASAATPSPSSAPGTSRRQLLALADFAVMTRPPVTPGRSRTGCPTRRGAPSSSRRRAATPRTDRRHGQEPARGRDLRRSTSRRPTSGTGSGGGRSIRYLVPEAVRRDIEASGI